MVEIVPVEKIPVADDVPMEEPSEVLKVASKLEKLCLDLKGMGISAVQVGIPWKLFLILYPEGKFRYFVNCSYEAVGDAKIPKSLEGCLSLPGRMFHIENHRWEKVLVKGYELVIDGNEPAFKEVEFEVNSKDSFLAGSIVFQHEIDHQLGQDGLISNVKTARELVLHPVKER